MPREIRSPRPSGVGLTAGGTDDYKNRLVKLIPSEIVTAFVTIQGLISAAGNGNEKQDTLMWIVIAVLFALTPLYLLRISNVRKWDQIIFTSIAFLIWVLAIGSPLGKILDFESTFIGSIMLVLYTLMIPFFYKG